MFASPHKNASKGHNYGGEKRLLSVLSAVALYVDATHTRPIRLFNEERPWAGDMGGES